MRELGLRGRPGPLRGFVIEFNALSASGSSASIHHRESSLLSVSFRLSAAGTVSSAPCARLYPGAMVAAIGLRAIHRRRPEQKGG